MKNNDPNISKKITKTELKKSKKTRYGDLPSDKGELFNIRKWLRTDGAAKYLGKSKNAITIDVSRGHLIKRKWRRRLYFKITELDRLLETSLN